MYVNLDLFYNCQEFKTIAVGKKAVVIGGGNVAINAARMALRLGTEKVSIFYRRSRDELPARKEEIENAKKRG